MKAPVPDRRLIITRMSIDSIIEEKDLKKITDKHQEDIEILRQTFKLTDKQFSTLEENAFKMYDRFLELYPLEKDRHGLILTYLTYKYYCHVTNRLMREYTKTKILPEAVIRQLYKTDIDHYVTKFVKQDSKTKK
jgi:hypothetical protein